MAEDTVMDTTIHEPSMTAGEVDMGLLDCWEIDLPFCAGELAEALLRCAELTGQTYPTQSQAPVSRSQERSTVLTRAGRWSWMALACLPAAADGWSAEPMPVVAG